MDVELGRKANEVANPQRLSEWLLEKGFSVRIFNPRTPSVELVEAYSGGTITFDEYLKRYEKLWGKVRKKLIPRLHAYTDDIVVPAFQRGTKSIEQYIEGGQARVFSDNLSEQVVSENLAVNNIFMFGYDLNSDGAHAISLHRPVEQYPLMKFEPVETSYKWGSSYEALGRDSLTKIIRENNPFMFVSNPEGLTRDNLGL